MVVQTRNEAISEDTTRQTMPTFKKPLTIPSPGPGERSSASHNKSKPVYHKQQAENDVGRKYNSAVKNHNNHKGEKSVKSRNNDKWKK